MDQSGSARAILGAMSDKLPPSLPQGELGRFRRGPSWRRMFKSKEAAAQHRKDKLPLDMTAGERMEAYGPSPGSPTQRTMMFSSQRGAMMHGVPVLPNSPPPGAGRWGVGQRTTRHLAILAIWKRTPADTDCILTIDGKEVCWALFSLTKRFGI